MCCRLGQVEKRIVWRVQGYIGASRYSGTPWQAPALARVQLSFWPALIGYLHAGPLRRPSQASCHATLLASMLPIWTLFWNSALLVQSWKISLPFHGDGWKNAPATFSDERALPLCRSPQSDLSPGFSRCRARHFSNNLAEGSSLGYPLRA